MRGRGARVDVEVLQCSAKDRQEDKQAGRPTNTNRERHPQRQRNRDRQAGRQKDRQ